MSAKKQVTQLSNSVLSLKFMHRADEAKVRQKLEEEQRRAQQEAQWVVGDFDRDELESVQFEYDNSYVSFMPNTFGRRSFGNFNKEVEKLSEEATQTARLALAHENETRDSVSDMDLAKHFKGIQQDKKRKRDKEEKNDAGSDWDDFKGRKATRFSHAATATDVEKRKDSKVFIKPE
ncbi:uncharacterized protein SPPG_04721 [Spizellomyces punctatus DAOM BR117]|uniref:M-phase phosphoprotein 6 n=1 Tax=Spizellomyces punctatus (strain DAOM BR117) TaxID=645134 RepID=A0A0L0HH05_SPIPD|nr:uncharacterized protein SPPG_04721 [Spizellomyces punctatus DAOM BR117]KND00398.1 hypothetical protein SPPG_04721 [Spizellomyces punctatus DAOM BR117]|eukprot:XP_016608437.1 hypothetical protein SPPG_04721 [Spizellomyces punctatus DAOM BR117]